MIWDENSRKPVFRFRLLGERNFAKVSVSEIVLDGRGFAGMEMKTGDAALTRSQEANYRAAIEGNASSFGAKAADAGLNGTTPRNIYLIRPNK